MKKIVAFLLLTFTVLAFACKKNNDKSVADQLQGKWYMTRDDINDHYFGEDHYDTAGTVNKGDFTIEFKGNQSYIYDGNTNTTDTSTFKVIEGPRLVFGDKGDTAVIKKLTGDQLIIYSKDYMMYPNYVEETQYFNKY